MKITAYTYNTRTHCPCCALRAFGATEPDALDDCLDRVGNPVTAAFDVDGYCDTCGMAYGNAEPVARCLSVDAWRDAGGWQWNNWHARGFVPLAWCDLSPRALLARLRDRNCYTLPAPGHAAIEDDGHNLVIIMRGTREPVFAIEYGSVPA